MKSKLLLPMEVTMSNNNPLQPIPCEILNVKKESTHEWTFRVASDADVDHGQFMQLSIPKVGEVPISVSGQGDGWLDFTIRSVGKVTNVIFEKEAGDTLFLRGPYGHGWPPSTASSAAIRYRGVIVCVTYASERSR